MRLAALLMALCGLEDPRIARQAPAVPAKPAVARVDWAGLPPVRRLQPDGRRYGGIGHARGGALAGVTIYVSAGHGFTWNSSLAGWRTQRGNTHALVEDLISAETIAQYLVPLLENMGAYVVTVRETDMSPAQAIVDDGDAGFALAGTGGSAAGPTGWGRLATPIADQANPFATGTSVVLTAAAVEDARATWTIDVPAPGDYDLFVGWVQDPTRASDAHYIVTHAGGDTHFQVDQRRHGGTWVRLGRFHFDGAGAVALANDSTEPGATLSADVVRIGGGMGVIDRGGGVSGRPMFENAARYHAQLAGAPPTVWDYAAEDNNDDVGTRSRFSAWEHEDGEDAVYIAWHTNAPSPARGTSSFAYGPSSFGPLSEFSGVPGSLELMAAVHGELIADLRASWEAGWQDRDMHTAYFGEVNPSHNPEMPAVLFEIAFHDTAEDADALRDPRFRYLAARAMAQGVAKYIAARDAQTAVLPPEPPSAPRMAQVGADAIGIEWDEPITDGGAGDAPTGYRVYLSRDGLGFDEGTPVSGLAHSVALPEDGGALYARITATNAGGESLPSRVVGARPAAGGQAQVLVLADFDRLDRGQVSSEDLAAYTLGTVDRAFLDRMNDGSHVARFGAALDAAQVSFATASDAAVADLSSYQAVVWQLGEHNQVLSAADRTAIADYLAGGGRLFLSGSEVAWALSLGAPEDQAFLADTLRVLFSADDAGSTSVITAGPPFDGMAAFGFDDAGDGSYPVDYPDVIEPGPGAGAALEYMDGTAGTAAIAWEQAVIFGFPFETIAGADVRAEVMARILALFGVEPDPVVDPEDPPGEGGCCRGSPGGAGWLVLAVAVGLLALRRRRR